MIHLFHTRIFDDLPTEVYHQYLNRLPPQLRAKTTTFRRRQDRINHIFGKILLMDGLEQLGWQPSLQELQVSEYGRPYLSEQFDFNISHSANYILCAISTRGRVGVDVEKIKPIDLSDFASTMSPKQWLIINSSRYPLREFFRYWTMKESTVKADSRGLQIPLDSISIRGQIATVDECRWHLEEVFIDKDYCAHISSEHALEGLLIYKVTIDGKERACEGVWE